jgi:hypothetical protein
MCISKLSADTTPTTEFHFPQNKSHQDPLQYYLTFSSAFQIATDTRDTILNELQLKCSHSISTKNKGSFPGRGKDFSAQYRAHIVTETQTASHPMGIGSSFPLSPSSMPTLRMHGGIPPIPTRPHGVEFN